MVKCYTLYILECLNGTFYVGYTTDLVRRYQEHLSGSAKCKYTRSFPPKRVCASWEFICTLSEILSLERQVKRLSRQEKERLVVDPLQFKQRWPDYAAMLSDAVSD